MQCIEIGGRIIGPGQPCMIIAEIGVNHNGDINIAKKLVDAAAEAGADVVKFQTYKAELITASDTPKAVYQQETTGKSESQQAMLKRLELQEDVYSELIKYCNSKGVLFMSSPFDEDSVRLLSRFNVSAYKIASGCLTDIPLLEQVAGEGKPIILSTGMSNLAEVGVAVKAMSDAGNDKIILLHCVTNYPADPADSNLRAIKTLKDSFEVPVGFSDHSTGIAVSLAAVALGACVVEKHITLSRDMEGPDHSASMEPQEFKELVSGIRVVESSLGNGVKEPADSESLNRVSARYSIVARHSIRKGSVLASEDLSFRRPGNGISPGDIGRLVGKKAEADIPSNTQILWEMVA